MNPCDYDHETKEETRLLPIGGGGNTITCHFHYSKEIWERIEWARERGQTIEEDYQFLPSWESLKVYAEAVK